jgi:hypothetical protein
MRIRMCYKLENIENFQKLNVKKPEMTKIIGNHRYFVRFKLVLIKIKF